MTSTETNTLQWKSDPLLTGKKQKTDFAQTSWDHAKERKFGSWTPESHAKSGEDLFQSDPPKSAHTDPSDETGTQIQTSDTDSAESPASESVNNGHLPNSTASPSSPVSDAPIVLTELNEQQIRIARQQGYVQGLKDGMAKTLHDLETDRAKEKDLIQAITSELGALKNDATRLHEPVRKLALHIAEQLVRGELSTSGEAIERLVKACVADVNGQEQGISVSLHPNDLERARPLLKNNEPPLNLQPDMALLPGSVRVRSNDTVIEDLIENRLEGLARQLLSEPETWLKNASRLAGTQVESVAPSFADRKKTATPSDIEDVPEKVAPKGAQDIEEVPDIEAVQDIEEVHDVDELPDIEDVRGSTPLPQDSVQSSPAAQDSDQPYL